MDRALGRRYVYRERERPFQRNHRTNPQPHRKQLQRTPRQQPPFTLNFQSAIIPPDRLTTPPSQQKTMQKLPKMLADFYSVLPPKECESSPPPTNISCRTTHRFCAKSLQQNFLINPPPKQIDPHSGSQRRTKNTK